jgi:PKD repeat protein
MTMLISMRRMHEVIVMITGLYLLSGGAAALGQTVLYVDADAASGGDGASWATAFDSLQAALDEAAINGMVEEVWVAEGVYYPTYEVDPNDARTATFQLVDDVAIYGGFLGDETSLGQRDIASYVTVLSGDLLGDDLDPNNVVENAYHVLTGDLNGPTAVLDGFTVTGGNADGVDPHDIGGGMINDTGNPTLANCIFTGNRALFGAAMFNLSSSPVLLDCEFNNNISTFSGGAIYNASASNPTLERCLLDGNMTQNDSSGGAMVNQAGCVPLLTDCTISNNMASAGAGIVNLESSPILTRCVISDNVGDNGGGIYNYIQSNSIMIDCTISNNTATNLGGGMANWESRPELTNTTVADNLAGGGGGFYNYFYSEPILTNCVVSGNEATSSFAYGGGFRSEDWCDALLINCTISDNLAARGAGIYNDNSDIQLVGCVVGANTASSLGGGLYNTTFSSAGFTNSALEGNVADEGGGIYNTSSDATLVNCLLIRNEASGSGGAAWIGTNMVMSNCTLTENLAADMGGGIYCAFSNPAITNSILWGNADNGGLNMDESAQIHVNGGAPTVDYSNVQGQWTGIGSDNLDQDPLFVDPNFSNYRLKPTSPCTEAGDNSLMVADLLDFDGDGNTLEPITADIELNVRIRRAVVDMGAYEYQPSDIDGDGLIQASDFVILGDCLAGPDLSPLPTPSASLAECLAAFDDNGDGDLDMADFAEFQVVYGLTLLMGPINHPPVAEDAAFIVEPGDSYSGQVVATDLDVVDPLTYEVFDAPTAGMLIAFDTITGEFTYQAPATPATDSFTFRAYDGVDWSNVATVDISVQEIIEPPTAVIDVDSTTPGEAPVIVNFDATGSFDPDGTIVSYDWDFDDGGDSNQPIVAHTFAANGVYNVTLTVVDNDGAFDTSTVQINVSSIADGLVAYWPLDDGGGPIASDQSGNGYAGDVIGAVWDVGRFGGALNFNGVSDRVEVGTFDISGSEMTISAWFNADDFDITDARIVSKSTGTAEPDHTWMLSTINDGGMKLRFRIKTDGQTLTLIGTQTINSGEWVHAVAVYDGSQMRLYTNGVETGTRPKSGTITAAPSVQIYIGDNPGVEQKTFDGLIDDVRLYERALAPAEILTLYQATPY